MRGKRKKSPLLRLTQMNSGRSMSGRPSICKMVDGEWCFRITTEEGEVNYVKFSEVAFASTDGEEHQGRIPQAMMMAHMSAYMASRWGWMVASSPLRYRRYAGGSQEENRRIRQILQDMEDFVRAALCILPEAAYPWLASVCGTLLELLSGAIGPGGDNTIARFLSSLRRCRWVQEGMNNRRDAELFMEHLLRSLRVGYDDGYDLLSRSHENAARMRRYYDTRSRVDVDHLPRYSPLSPGAAKQGQ